jgi:hypothetical protein
MRPGFRQFRDDVRRLLEAIGIGANAASDRALIEAWLEERTAAEFAFNFAEQIGQISLRAPARS